ncbi:MAG: tRNA threonylcarbamoyladenosine dehydratase [Treponema sp.]|nr:tRNA threonylcarbamoyladenosine dehydratase [Treponema sp.]
MLNQFSRTELLLGKEAMKILSRAHVAVFGVGGVGGYVVEALVRSGISHIDIIDNDTVSLTNINRQIIASHATLGRPKVDVMKERILDINPDAEVKAFKCFYLPETRNLFDFSEYDYVIDAVDTVTAKIQLILQAKEAGVPVISSMGAGNKLNPMTFEVADISQTSVCPLARVMRQECKKRGIKDVKVVYSREKPVESRLTEEEKKSAEQKGNGVAPGSCAFVPSVAGLIIASEVIKDLTAKARNV